MHKKKRRRRDAKGKYTAPRVGGHLQTAAQLGLHQLRRAGERFKLTIRAGRPRFRSHVLANVAAGLAAGQLSSSGTGPVRYRVRANDGADSGAGVARLVKDNPDTPGLAVHDNATDPHLLSEAGKRSLRVAMSLEGQSPEDNLHQVADQCFKKVYTRGDANSAEFENAFFYCSGRPTAHPPAQRYWGLRCTARMHRHALPVYNRALVGVKTYVVIAPHPTVDGVIFEHNARLDGSHTALSGAKYIEELFEALAVVDPSVLRMHIIQAGRLDADGVVGLFLPAMYWHFVVTEAIDECHDYLGLAQYHIRPFDVVQLDRTRQQLARTRSAPNWAAQLQGMPPDETDWAAYANRFAGAVLVAWEDACPDYLATRVAPGVPALTAQVLAGEVAAQRLRDASSGAGGGGGGQAGRDGRG